MSASTVINAPAERVYEMISDVTRMREWSPETKRCRWIRGADGPRVGAWFTGTNAYRGRWWRTVCRVVAATPGREFAFEVTADSGQRIATIHHRFAVIREGE